MTTVADLERHIAMQQLLLDQQGAALLALLERVALLERQVAFEIGQREALEPVIVRVASLPLRMDHVEAEIAAVRKLPRGVRVVVAP